MNMSRIPFSPQIDLDAPDPVDELIRLQKEQVDILQHLKVLDNQADYMRQDLEAGIQQSIDTDRIAKISLAISAASLVVSIIALITR